MAKEFDRNRKYYGANPDPEVERNEREKRLRKNEEELANYRAKAKPWDNPSSGPSVSTPPSPKSERQYLGQTLAERKNRESIPGADDARNRQAKELSPVTTRQERAVNSAKQQVAESNKRGAEYNMRKREPVKPATVDAPSPAPKQRSFASAFAAARMDGKKEFTWNGKRYHTRRADGK
jgi:hypothetical protein